MLKEFSDDIVRRAKQNLGATQDRWGISAKWKGGKPKSFKRKKSRRHISRGNLNRSIKYKLTDTSVTFSMAAYGQWVDEGRQGKKDVWGIGVNSSAKGAPVDVIKEWAKKIRPKDENGKFIKKTDKVMDSLAYLVNRKIKWFGIAPSHFFRDAVETTMNEYEDLGINIVDSIFEK